jgi:hypothetical protein
MSADKKNTGDASWMKRGHAITEGAEQEAERQARQRESRASNNRFWIPNKEGVDKKTGIPLNEADIVILDDSISGGPNGDLDGGVALYEHSIPGADGSYGKGSSRELCCKELEPCPLCDKYGDSKYLTFITVLDLRGYEKESGEWVPYTRKLLAINSRDLNAFRQIEAAAIKKTGTLRGTFLTMVRDTKNAQSSSIGAPAIRDNGMLFASYSEKQLVKEFGHKAIKGRDGKTILEADELLTPLDYLKVFPKPEAADLAKRYHVRPTAGSREDIRSEWGEGDELPMGGSSRRRRGPSSDDGDQAGEDDAPTPRRGRAPVAEEGDDAPTPRRGRKAPEAEEAAEEGDDEPPARRRAPAAQEEVPAGRRRRPLPGNEPFGDEK